MVRTEEYIGPCVCCGVQLVTVPSDVTFPGVPHNCTGTKVTYTIAGTNSTYPSKKKKKKRNPFIDKKKSKAQNDFLKGLKKVTHKGINNK